MNIDWPILWNRVSAGALDLLVGLLILLLGWIIARIVASVVRSLLKRTDIDEKLSRSLSGEGDDGGPNINLQEIIPTILFWTIFLLAVIAFFNRLDLPAVSAPLQAMLTQIFFFLPGILAAAAILVGAWLLATVVHMLLKRVLGRADIDGRLQRQGATGETDVSIIDTLANVLYWFILLLAIPPALDALGMDALVGPIRSMLDEILGALPNVLKAILVLLIGWFIARIIRQIVTSLAAAVGVDRLGARAGLDEETRVSRIIGTIVFAFILIPAIIAAIEALGIASIAAPATAMLALITSAIPGIIAAILLLVITYYVGKLISGLIVNVLKSIGFDSLPRRLGINVQFERSPSEIVGAILLAGFMLFASLEASRLIGFDALAVIIAQIINFAGEILLGIIVFAIGLYVANFVYSIMSASTNRNADLLARVARAAILILVGTMALRQMGIASETVDLAFGILLGALGIAFAISVGLGTRDIAHREVDRFIKRLRGHDDDIIVP